MPQRTHRESYLVMDHRACPGLGPIDDGTHATLGYSTFVEVKTYTCSHCQRGIIVNPRRQRARPYCPKCDHYVCDRCEVIRVASGGVCRTFEQVIEEIIAKAIGGGNGAIEPIFGGAAAGVSSAPA